MRVIQRAMARLAKRIQVRRILRLALAAVLLVEPSMPWVGVTSVRAQSLPTRMAFQGRLTDASNNPITGARNFDFAVYDASTAGNLLWSESQVSVPVANGVFAVHLGASVALTPDVFAAGAAYLQITVNGDPLTPRERLVSSPYAFNAQRLAGLSYSAFVSTDAAPQTILGDKTFAGTLSVPSPSANAHAASKAYVDAQVAGGGSGWTDDGSVVRMTASGDNVLIQSTLTVSGNAFSVGGSTLAVAGGRVGIGTTAPADRMHVQGSAGTAVRVADSSSDAAFIAVRGGTGDSYLRLAGASNWWLTNSNALGGRLAIAQSQGGNLLTLDPSGAVGIGSTNPQHRLYVSSGNIVGDYGVGAATVSLRGLGAAPAGAAGMLYYDAALSKLRLYNGSWVDIATGTTGGGDFVMRTGDAMSGPLTNTSTVTVLGNAFSVGGSTFAVSGGNVGFGVSNPGEKLHLNDGNFLMNAAGEQEFRMRRTGLANNPAFKLGRMILAGDGSPEFRVLYNDDVTPERSVLEFDNKGIVASVKPAVGSHFEGFIGGEVNPLFRLNSFPAMQLEMGPGGGTAPDVAVRRAAADSLSLLTGGLERVRIDGGGRLGIGSSNPAHKLYVSSGNIVGDYGVAAATLSFTGLGAAPAGAAGMLYYDNSSAKLRLYNGSWVDIATGTTGGGNFVLRQGDGMSGPLTMAAGSTITVGGNAFSVGGSTFVVNAGNVGIGTSDPATPFHLRGSGNLLTLFRTDTGHNLVIEPNSLNSTTGGISLNAVGGNAVTIDRGSGAGDVPLNFFHRDFGGVASRIVASGNDFLIGIEDSTFDRKLKLRTFARDRMTIDKDGKVGVGTTNPAATLHVSSAPTAGGTNLLLVSTGSATSEQLLAIDNGGNIIAGTKGPSASAFYMRNGPLYIQSPGSRSLGFVDDNDAERGSILMDDADMQLRIAGAYKFIVNSAYTASYVPFKILTASPDRLKFGYDTNVADIQAWDSGEGTPKTLGLQASGGLLGLGTTSPAYKLDVTGGGLIVRSSFTLAGMSAPPVSAADQGALYYDSAADKFRISENGGGFVDLAPSGASAWTKVGAVLNPTAPGDNVVVQSTLTVLGNAFSVGGSTLVVAGGNLGIGTTNPQSLLTIASRGFPGSIYMEFDSSSSNAFRSVGERLNVNWDGNQNVTFFEGASASETPLLKIHGRKLTDSSQRTLSMGISGSVDDAFEFSGVGNYLFNGKLGVGASAPVAALHVSSAATAAAEPIFIVSSGTAAGQELLRVRKDGRVGVGTTSPARGLEVAAAGGEAAYVRITGGPDGGSARLELKKGSAGTDHLVDFINWNGSWLGSIGMNPSGNFVFYDSSYNVPLMINMSTRYVGVNETTVYSTMTVGGALGLTGIAQPEGPAADRGIIYFDKNSDKFRVSENNGSFVDLVNQAAAGGWTDDGTVVRPTASGDNVLIQSTLTVSGNAFSVGGSTLTVAGGRVGMGTTAPGSRLHLSTAAAGSIDLLTLEQNDGTINNQTGLLFNANANKMLGRIVAINQNPGADRSQMKFYTNNGAGAVTNLSLLFNGDAGIGVEDPQARLEIGGNGSQIYLSGTTDSNRFIANNPGTAYMGMKIYGTPGVVSKIGLGYAPNITTMLADVLTVTNEGTYGRVGISTASPATNLDVSGNAQFGSGALKSTFTAVPGAGTFALELSSGALLGNGGPVRLTAGGYVEYPDGTRQTTGSPGDSSRVAKAGDFMSGQLTIAGSSLTVRTDAASSPLLVSTSATPGVAGLFVDGSNKVGVGTASPTRRLSIVDDSTDEALRVENTVTNGEGIYATAKNDGIQTYTTGSGAALRAKADGNGTVIIAAIGANKNAAGILLASDGASASAKHLLEVTHDNSALSGDAIKVDVVSAGNGSFTGNYLKMMKQGSPRFIVNQYGNVGISTGAPNAQFHVQSSTGEAEFVVQVSSQDAGSLLVVRGDGKVGIGTSAPGEKLEVSGNIKLAAAGNSLSVPTNNTTLLLEQSSASGFPSNNTGWQLRAASGAVRKLYFYNSSLSDGVNFLVDGAVGIGTTAPAAALHVSSAATAATEPLFIVSSGTAAGQELLRVRKDGNVGIGTTAPGASLEVKGTMKVMGGWSAGSFGTDTQAATDGFVVAAIGVDSGDTCELAGYTDSSATPTTVRATDAAFDPGTTARVVYGSLMMPVRKGDYWRVDRTASAGTCTDDGTVYFVPLGI